MTIRKIKIVKTAKILIDGNTNSSKLSKLIIALHGYGELAENFIRNFSFLDFEENMIIAPEALNRFYLKGFHGKVGATWMTKEERDDEILDQTLYLNNIIQMFKDDSFYKSTEKIVFGFSQGTATAVRWILNSEFIPNKLILWGGSIPNDCDLIKISEISKKCKIFICIGDEDEFISSERIDQEKTFLNENRIKHNLVLYKGKHKIYQSVLENIL